MKKEEEMSLLDHLDEFRKRLTIVAVVNLAATMVFFSKASLVMDYLLAINPGMQLVYISPSELLFTYIQLSFIMALVACFPINAYELWAFIEKGLYKREKVYFLVSLFFGVLCFVCGVVFCYVLVLPTTLEFFVRIAITEVQAMISVREYVSFVNMMLISFGVVFEMPVVVFLLSKLDIVTPQMLRSNRSYIIVLIFILAAIITPPDVVSQTMLAIPMLVLLQISIFISAVVEKGNRKKRLQESTT